MQLKRYATTLAFSLMLSVPGIAQPPAFEIIGAMGGSENQQGLTQDYASLDLDGTVDAVPSARHTISYAGNLAPGSILVKTGQRKLLFVLPDKQAIEYPVGVGREGFTWSGRNTVSRKAEWPRWRPPAVMIKREARKGHDLPDEMPGGPQNPLGARALYIGGTEYRIHGTTQPWSIGHAVSSGCIRMLNADVIDLYDRVSVGATVLVER